MHDSTRVWPNYIILFDHCYDFFNNKMKIMKVICPLIIFKFLVNHNCWRKGHFQFNQLLKWNLCKFECVCKSVRITFRYIVQTEKLIQKVWNSILQQHVIIFRGTQTFENNTVNNGYASVYEFGHRMSYPHTSPMRNSNNNVLICKILWLN